MVGIQKMTTDKAYTYTPSGPKDKKKITSKNVVTERLDKSKTVKTKKGEAVTFKKKKKDYRGNPGK